MKWLISLLAIAALSGCVAYVPDRYDTGVYYGSGYRYSGDRYYGGRHYGGRSYRDWDDGPRAGVGFRSPGVSVGVGVGDRW